jgi:hypothetical protein
VLALEPGDGVGQQFQADGRHGRNAKMSALPFLETPGQRPEGIQRIVRPLCLLEQHARFGGRNEPASLPLEQPYAEPRLGLLDRGGYGGLGHPQPPRGLGHRAAGHDREKHFNVAKIHRRPASGRWPQV